MRQTPFAVAPSPHHGVAAWHLHAIRILQPTLRRKVAARGQLPIHAIGVEEILVALIQFVLNVLGQSLMWLPFDFCPRRDRPESRAGAAFLALLGGGLVGWGSLHFFPDTHFRFAWLRIAVLIVSSLAAGWLGYVLAELRCGLGHNVDSRDHFWYAFSFALGLSAIRFAYAHHVGA